MPDEAGADFLEDIDKRALFSKVHVLRTLLLLRGGALGRTRLARRLGIGEASVKTLLKYLTEKKIVKPSTKGHILTEKGQEIVEKLKEKILGPVRLENLEITVDDKNVAFLVKDSASEMSNGIEQRDAVVKEGAKGATTISYKDGNFWLLEEKTVVPEKLRNEFSFEDGDVIVIGSASSYKKAEEGALAAAMTLFQD